MCRIYDASKGALSRDGLTLKIAAATIAASIGSSLANPADLVKGASAFPLPSPSPFPLFLPFTQPHARRAVRLQAHYPNGSPYESMRHAFATIWQDGARAAAVAGASPLAGGVRAMYRGVVPTTVRGIVLSATQICSYDQIKQSLKRRGVMQEGVPLHLTASMFAGCVGPRRSLGCVWRLMVGRL